MKKSIKIVKCRHCKSEMIRQDKSSNAIIWLKIAIGIFVVPVVIMILAWLLTMIDHRLLYIVYLIFTIDGIVVLVRLIAVTTGAYITYTCPKCNHSIKRISILGIILGIIEEIF